MNDFCFGIVFDDDESTTASTNTAPEVFAKRMERRRIRQQRKAQARVRRDTARRNRDQLLAEGSPSQAGEMADLIWALGSLTVESEDRSRTRDRRDRAKRAATKGTPGKHRAVRFSDELPSPQPVARRL